MTTRRANAVLAAVIAGIALAASAIASSSPDGLERVAADLGFERRAEVIYAAPMPDYAVAGVPARGAGPLAAVVGTVVVGAIAWGAGRLVRRKPFTPLPPRPRIGGEGWGEGAGVGRKLR